jgi:hypothetical protein
VSELARVDVLTPAERDRLAELKAVVDRGIKTFVEVGLALAEIRETRLYRETHPTFEMFCREHWGFAASRARQLIGAAELVGVTGVTPANEAQARQLIPLLRDEGADAVVEVWREIQAEYGMKVAAPQVKAVVVKWIESRMGRLDSRKIRGRPNRSLDGRDIRMAAAGETRIAYIREALREAVELINGTHPTERTTVIAEVLPVWRRLLRDLEKIDASLRSDGQESEVS